MISIALVHIDKTRIMKIVILVRTNPPDLATPVVTSASVESVTISFTSSYLSPSLIVRARFCGLAMINTALDVEGTLNALVLLGKLLISSSLNVTIFVTTLVLTCPSKKLIVYRLKYVYT